MGYIEVPRRYVKFSLFLVFIFLLWNYVFSDSWKTHSEKLFSVSSNHQTQNVFDLYKYSAKELAITEMYQDDEELVEFVRERFLLPPVTMDYNLTKPDLLDQSMGQGAKIRQILGDDMKNGFFVECGALDGETRSNSLFFERFLGWKGLLIEADPLNFAQVIEKRRKAWLAPTCLSLERRPQLVRFRQAKNVGKILDEENFKGKSTEVLCIPITTLLLALNQKRIDYFSLDVEGNELDVLRTIDFDKFDIRTMSVEFKHVKAGKDTMEAFMNEKGYEVHSTVTRSDSLANDFIFMKKKKQ